MRKLFAITLAMTPLLACAKLPVVASFSIVADVAREVGGERVDVVSLVAPDQDAHVFQPSPADVRKLAAAKVFVVNGLGFEGWMARLSKSAAFKGLTVTAAAKVKPLTMAEHDEHDDHHGHDHGHDHGKQDPHAWHNPQNVALYAEALAAGFAKADPEGAAYYRQRAQAYKAQLLELDGWAAKSFAAIPAERRKVLTSHDAFAYLAARYKLRFMAPQGVSTDAEASAKGVAALIRQVRKEKVSAVFFENMADRRLLDQLSREAGVKVGGKLYSDALSAAPEAATYMQLFKTNVGALVAAMK